METSQARITAIERADVAIIAVHGLTDTLTVAACAVQETGIIRPTVRPIQRLVEASVDPGADIQGALICVMAVHVFVYVAIAVVVLAVAGFGLRIFRVALPADPIHAEPGVRAGAAQTAAAVETALLVQAIGPAETGAVLGLALLLVLTEAGTLEALGALFLFAPEGAPFFHAAFHVLGLRQADNSALLTLAAGGLSFFVGQVEKLRHVHRDFEQGCLGHPVGNGRSVPGDLPRGRFSHDKVRRVLVCGFCGHFSAGVEPGHIGRRRRPVGAQLDGLEVAGAHIRSRFGGLGGAGEKQAEQGRQAARGGKRAATTAACGPGGCSWQLLSHKGQLQLRLQPFAV